jgi:hypothetical protein
LAFVRASITNRRDRGMKTCFSLGSTFFFVSERRRRRSWKFSLGIDLHYPRWTGLQAKSRGVLMLGCHAHVSLVPHDQSSQPSRPWSSGPPAWNSGATALLRSPCTPLSLSPNKKKGGSPRHALAFFLHTSRTDRSWHRLTKIAQMVMAAARTGVALLTKGI